MIDSRIIRSTRAHPTAGSVIYFEIETVHKGRLHRSNDRAYQTEDEARAAATEQDYQVDATLYEA